MADAAAHTGSVQSQADVKLDHASAKAEIRRSYNWTTIEHNRIRSVYSTPKLDISKEQSLSRGEQVDLTRILSGHHPETLDWQKRTPWRLCGKDSETPYHIILDCPALRSWRNPEWDLGNFARDSVGVLGLWHKWREKTQL